jgi:TonB family protein
MKQDSTVMESVPYQGRVLATPPKLLVELESWRHSFVCNLLDILWPQRQPSLNLASRPGQFWPDVFVPSALPWRGVLQSSGYHILLVAGAVLLSHFWPHPAEIATQSTLHEDVVYYSPEELPPLDTGTQHPAIAQKGDPAFAAQPIISVPPDSDNHKQTIVTPPNVKLDRDVPMPNIVAWSPTQPLVPLAATEHLPASVKLPVLPTTVVAPAPDVMNTAVRKAALLQPEVVAPAPEIRAVPALRGLQLEQSAVVAPALNIQATAARRMGDLNIGHQQVVAPAPQFPVPEQRAALLARAGVGMAPVVAPAPKIEANFSRRTGAIQAGTQQVVAPAPDLPQQGVRRTGGTTAGTMLSANTAVVPPAPAFAEAHGTRGGGEVIALNLHPLPPPTPVAAPTGNRRGTFAATPQGKVGALGTPENKEIQSGATDSSAAGARTDGLPAGLHVGAPDHVASATGAGGEKAGATRPVLSASVTTPRVRVDARPVEIPADHESELERKVFAGRRFYSMTLNLPNLNSATGSWIIRFAELKDGNGQGKLIAPEAVHEVDPGYPLELMRRNVGGTVTLYAVIHTDGSVGDVKVLEGIDDRLDEYACKALARWQFLPAMRDGSAIALAAVVKIPFRPTRGRPAF